MTVTVKLYYWPGYCSLATHIVLNWLDVPFELEKAGLTVRKSAAFFAINPSRTVPVIQNGDEVLSQNTAILNYLADSHPEAQLNGDGSPWGRAIVNRWLGYVNSDVHKAFSPLHHPERLLGGDDAKTQASAQAKASIRGHFEIVDAALANHSWIAGARRSIADPYLFVLLRWGQLFEIETSDLAHLTGYFDRMASDPAVIKSLAEEKIGRRLVN
jgi:glutathione S-transferase